MAVAAKRGVNGRGINVQINSMAAKYDDNVAKLSCSRGMAITGENSIIFVTSISRITIMLRSMFA